MKKRRVLVFTNHSLLISGLLSLLREHPEIELITGEDEGQLSRKIGEAAPEVVVIDTDQAGPEGLNLGRFLRENPRSTLVALSLDQPGMAIVRARRVPKASWESLLSVVDGAHKRARRALASRPERQNTER